MNEAERDTLLIRLDERTKRIAADTKELDEKFDKYVTQKEFSPVQKIVYGLIALIVVAVVSTWIAIVVRPPETTSISARP